MVLFDLSKSRQQQLAKSRWLNLLLPMGGLGLLLLALVALLISLSYHSLNALAGREAEERMLESASQMALQLTHELQQVERHGSLLADQTTRLLQGENTDNQLRALTSLLNRVYEGHDLINLVYLDSLNSVKAVFPKTEEGRFFSGLVKPKAPANQADHLLEKRVWTLRDSYLTGAGQAFGFVYSILEEGQQTAEVGLEVTLDSLESYLAKLSVPWGGYSLLMNAEGQLLIDPLQAVDAWQTVITKNLVALEPLLLDASGLITLNLDDEAVLLSWASVKPTGWKLLNVATEKKVFAVKNQLIDDYRLVLLLGAFFILIMFLVLVFLVARRDKQLVLANQARSLPQEKQAPAVLNSGLNQAEFMEWVTGPLLVCQFNAEGSIVACNSAFEHLAGSTLTNLKNRNLLKLLGLKSFASGNAVDEVELRLGQQEAVSFWFSVHYSVKGDGLLFLLDISHYKQVQQQLSGECQRARLAAKMKAEFFQVAVSDANTLLLDLLKNARGFDAALTSYCQGKLIDLQHLLDDMRDMSEAGEVEQQELVEETLVLSLLVEDCYTASQNLLANSGRRLLIEYGANIPENLVLDRRRLLRLMRHLLRQMIQLSTKGDIYLWLGWVESGRLQLKMNDQGGGLAASERLRRFQLTTPLSGSYEASSGALGLGQLLTRQLIHEMRGSLEVVALDSGGLQLKIELPARLMASTTDVSLGRILVVDDGPVNAMLATSVLEKSGYQVDVANSGAEALVLGLQQDYDLVLMDIFMPEMDGLETTRRWRKLNVANAQVPIVALTANAMEAERERFLQEGLDDYLAKPYRPDELRERVQTWLQKK